MDKVANRAIIKNVSQLKRSVESNERKRLSTTVSDKVKKHLKNKYGTVSNGINTLGLKDMGELE